MNVIDTCRERARSDKKRIVFTEACDDRVLRAVSVLAQENIAFPCCVGDSDRIAAAAREYGISMNGVEFVPMTDALRQKYTRGLMEKRDMKEEIADRLMQRPLYFGGMMVDSGDADAMIAGACTPTASILKAAVMTVGLRDVVKPASFMLLIPPENGIDDRILAFTDPAVNIKPSAAEIAVAAVDTARIMERVFSITPYVAFLSFSTKGSAQHAGVDLMRDACRIAKENAADIAMDGELQGDAALIPHIAERKAGGSASAGKANVLVFPDLNAGNIAYKLVSCLGNYRAYGPFLLGFGKPVNDLSRGASSEDIIGTAAVTAVRASLGL